MGLVVLYADVLVLLCMQVHLLRAFFVVKPELVAVGGAAFGGRPGAKATLGVAVKGLGLVVVVHAA